MSLYKCKMYVSRVETILESLSFHDFRFSMSLSLSPNSLYRQTTDCTEGGGLTREHCIYIYNVRNHMLTKESTPSTINMFFVLE